MTRPVCLIPLFTWFIVLSCTAQDPKHPSHFTHDDTLRGSITPERSWWDVLRYDIHIRPDYNQESIEGSNQITFAILSDTIRTMQIDLQPPLQIDSVFSGGERLNAKKIGTNAWHVFFTHLPRAGQGRAIGKVTIYYHGKPRIAKRPPWDGGWIFTRDSLGRPWMTVACQGLGASIWYPCKDHQSDEPDSGASLSITVPDTLVAVGNGRLKSKRTNPDGSATFVWEVVNPINNYDIIPYIGKYQSWHDIFKGEKGKLDLDFWALDYDADRAHRQFPQVVTMLHCFENWMGPYPFYEDGYQIVEAPHLGMEHQSAIAYGNHFENGYLGRDLSGTGFGLGWDFIIVHESGHEWFGNNITTKDLADMWIHEGFTNYSETLFTTCKYGVEAGNEYCIGTRKHIRNDIPIIPHYGVNEEGSEDMYYKGGNLIHMIRQIINNDEQFRAILRGLNHDFYHQTVTSRQIEDYISAHAHHDFSKVFDQYLRTTQIPVLEYTIKDHTLSYRWINCIQGFAMPVKIHYNQAQWISPTENWQEVTLPPGDSNHFSVDPNFYVGTKEG